MLAKYKLNWSSVYYGVGFLSPRKEVSTTAYIYTGISLQNKRASNMDCLLIKERQISGQPVYLAAVCDGVGSLESGGFAAASAVRMLSEWFGSLSDTRRLGLSLRDRVVQANREIIDAAAAHNFETASTLSALLLAEDRFYIVHMGDSRIYALENGALTQLTRDHSQGGKLASCIGRWESPTIDYNESSLSGQRFLLCSDGLYKCMDPGHLSTQLAKMTRRSINKLPEKLAKYVIDQGETDNISLAVLMKES